MNKLGNRLAEIERKLASLDVLRGDLDDEVDKDVVERQMAKLRAQRAALGGGAAARLVTGDEVQGDKVGEHQIVAHTAQVTHQYAGLHPGVEAQDLQRQAAEYLDWVKKSFGTVQAPGF